MIIAANSSHFTTHYNRPTDLWYHHKLLPLSPVNVRQSSCISFFPQRNSLPAIAQSLENLTSVNPYLFQLVCGMQSLTVLFSIFHIGTPDFVATTTLDQHRPNLQTFKHPHACLLL